MCVAGCLPTTLLNDTMALSLYAVYGGVFIGMSYCWGYLVEGTTLDTGDIVGSGARPSQRPSQSRDQSRNHAALVFICPSCAERSNRCRLLLLLPAVIALFGVGVCLFWPRSGAQTEWTQLDGSVEVDSMSSASGSGEAVLP